LTEVVGKDKNNDAKNNKDATDDDIYFFHFSSHFGG
jgi:hypothetical protein